jgi:prepilin-type N-terminal cleavage/methylation domain-containing protein
MKRCPGGFSLLEMLVVLAIIAILGTTVVVPRWDLSGRRQDLAADEMAAGIADALRRSRGGEDWRLAWNGSRLRLWRPAVAAGTGGGQAERNIELPSGAVIRSLTADGQPWPEDQSLALTGFSTPLLRLELAMGAGTVTLKSSPIGRVERATEAAAP